MEENAKEERERDDNIAHLPWLDRLCCWMSHHLPSLYVAFFSCFEHWVFGHVCHVVLLYLDTEHADHAEYLDHAEMKENLIHSIGWDGLRFTLEEQMWGMVTCVGSGFRVIWII